ncbi:hypothetical protein CH35J_003427 [Colletotrichum higginsianum]|uniref:Uncharacterized protein n=1 Tax=Colletotrichum higginsianum TaxID=80884 RepID=A0A4T0W8G8_9PEZI|nr:hypothetical protein CH35J_003427 [Colletotrichum higginsianum]
MHVPSIRQSATVGIAFCAIVAVAAPVAAPVDLGADAVDIVKRAPEPVPNNVDNISPFNDAIVKRDELEKRRDRNNKCRRDKNGGKKGCNYDDDYENYRSKGGGRHGGGRGGGNDGHVQDQPNDADHDDNDLNKRDDGGDGDNKNNGAWDDMLNKGGYGGGHGGKGGGGGGGGGWGGGGWGGGGGGGGGCKGGKKCGGGWGDGWNDDRKGGRKGGKKGPWRRDEDPENVDD